MNGPQNGGVIITDPSSSIGTDSPTDNESDFRVWMRVKMRSPVHIQSFAYGLVYEDWRAASFMEIAAQFEEHDDVVVKIEKLT